MNRHTQTAGTYLVAACAALASLSGCGLASGLSAESTCEEFNQAPVQEQRTIIQELVIAKENGRSNPLREANAVMQITYTCQSPGAGDTVLGKIAI